MESRFASGIRLHNSGIQCRELPTVVDAVQDPLVGDVDPIYGIILLTVDGC